MVKESKPKRREIVKGIGLAGSFSILGSTPVLAEGSTNNLSEEQSKKLGALKEEYSTIKEVMKVLRGQGDELLRNLAEHDILDNPSAEQFRPNSLLSSSEYRDGAEGVYVSAIHEDGTATARISVRQETPDHVVKLYFRPQLSEDYAIIDPHDGQNNVTIFNSDGTVMGHCDYVGDYCSFQEWGCEILAKYEVYACGTECNKGDFKGCCSDGESTPCG